VGHDKNGNRYFRYMKTAYLIFWEDMQKSRGDICLNLCAGILILSVERKSREERYILLCSMSRWQDLVRRNGLGHKSQSSFSCLDSWLTNMKWTSSHQTGIYVMLVNIWLLYLQVKWSTVYVNYNPNDMPSE
jgi:hypothetical protein